MIWPRLWAGLWRVRSWRQDCWGRFGCGRVGRDAAERLVSGAAEPVGDLAESVDEGGQAVGAGGLRVENKAWLRICRLPAYTPDMNPAEGIWPRSSGPWPTSRPPAGRPGRMIKRKLKKIQYRPHLIDGCLAATGLTIEPW